MDIDWSKAPLHATHWCPGNAGIEAGWIYNVGGEFYSCYADKGLEHLPEFPAWREDRLIQRPPRQPWSGSGPPPVGMACEFIKHNSPPAPKGQWETGKILYLSDCTIVIGVDGGERVHHPRNCSYRPIRTPEQIAIEIRSKAITQLMCDLDVPTAIATRAYDAGYRKQASP